MPSRVASWHQGSRVSVISTPMRRRRSSRPWSVIFGNIEVVPVVGAVVRSGGMRGLHLSACGRDGLGIAQRLAVDLPRGRLGKVGDEGDVARILVLAQARPHELLQLARERVVAGPRADDEGLDD